MSLQGFAADAAFNEVAQLLATAYQRYTKVQRVQADRAEIPVNKELAIDRDQSVHVNCR